MITLPWGPRTNWVQNVLVAQGCTIRWKGAEYRATEPRLVGKAVALQAAGAFQRFAIQRAGFAAFLQLTR